MKRIFSKNIHIDHNSIKEFYKKRALDKVSIDIDAPVVLCGDKDKDKIEAWTSFELKNRIPLLHLDSESNVLEVGCGTGRISKYITPKVNSYVGNDYVKEFIDIIKYRSDIVKKDKTFFIHSSIQDLTYYIDKLPIRKKFNRFVISGGVLMYVNDDELEESLGKLIELFDDECILYISEPIALDKRLTLDKFYSENLESEYSAIYRTEEEYLEIFNVFLKKGFELKVSEEFFYEDIKAQKETKQWFFILQRKTK
ncbi:methyltransferase domain-containing protein [Bacillus sinesaloumensis]|uniref:methyltransferase domain-containing protein n=1 Tax=Litchfieldia sinesaloumensis TaxID=1926280 RepID=UPI0009887E88|nr:methyltransferase domain-containing protein [Bacillus sinesaloumensis]